MRKGRVSLAGQIRRSGARVHRGPWTVFAAPGRPLAKGLIVALGRTAGCAVVRSRVRRVAREVHLAAIKDLEGAAFLVTARSEVGGVPRRRMREAIDELLRRGHQALTRRRPA